ncbi:DsrE family protein [Haloarcula marina]|uniref:DsrE family protein n=1 Tax=Haloarcula marina TaxID=2961574 RepID=UPI0020B7DD1C|nr:DsrE family protein [Halomicroarcula marina]
MRHDTDAYGTVFHVPESGREYAERAFRNVANLLDDETLDSDITVVCNGGGAGHVLASAVTAGTVETLVAEDVDVCVCRNSLDAADIDTSMLVDGVRVVPTAMGELTRRQSKGDAYIRP